ncbi:MAG: hypothetical protein SGILL_001277 [Bacillariaceae sp.]
MLTGRATKSNSSQTKTPRRKDIRDLATVAIYTALQTHAQCLQEVAKKNPSLEVVNDHDGDSEAPPPPHGVFLAPDLSAAISNLCSSAASSVPNSSYTDQAQWNRTMTVIAGAHMLDLLNDPTLPLDCKLAKFALTKFSDSLESLSSPGGSRVRDVSLVGGTQDASANELQERLQKQYSLSEMLPVPSSVLEGHKTKKKSNSATLSPNDCTYAGTLASDCSVSTGSFTDEQAVCLLMRGLQGRDSERTPTSKIIPFLVDVVRRSYDNRDQKDPTVHDEDASQRVPTSRKRKRTTREAATDRASTDRKTESGVATTFDERATRKQLSASCASAALGAVNALRACFAKSKGATVSLSVLIRATATAETLSQIVMLGSILDNILLPNDPPSGAKDMTYRAHMALCQLIGRGRATYEGRVGLDSVVWDSTKRNKVYCLLASSGASNQSETNSKWPLSMSAAHHAFFAANMTCVQDSNEKTPERMVVGGTIRSILKELDILTTEKEVDDVAFANRADPLSYNDARTFVLALNELPVEEKRNHLDCLVQAVLGSLKIAIKNETTKQKLISNVTATTFLARVLVTLNDLKSIFEDAFSLGFDCAPKDFSYLLFVGWNGLDALPEGPAEEELFSSFFPYGTNYSAKILQLRSDVCRVHRFLGNVSAPRLKLTLKSMISNAHAFVERILKEYFPEDAEVREPMPAPVIVLLAALPGYVSFAIACFSKRGSDHFSTNLAKVSGAQGIRERAYSSESEPPPSDIDSDRQDEDEDDIRDNALSRLRQICEVMGAAPIHPDWLDVSCSLRHGLGFAELTDIAELALKTSAVNV